MFKCEVNLGKETFTWLSLLIMLLKRGIFLSFHFMITIMIFSGNEYKFSKNVGEYINRCADRATSKVT